MALIDLFRDYNVPIAPESHHHYRRGWVNVECPYCTGNPGYHLGFKMNNPHYFCWRCGYHPIRKTTAILLNVPDERARELLKRYGVNDSQIFQPEVTIEKKPHQLPSGVGPLSWAHKKYLEKRGFDPDKLEKEWWLVGTGPVSHLDKIDYKWRIIIPFIWNDIEVSFDSRDITERQKSRYKACPTSRELISHKNILYGKTAARSSVGLIVEGPTDVWRMGMNTYAVSGIEYTREQMRLIAQLYNRVFIIFDPDPQAGRKAEQLKIDLSFRNVKTEIIDLQQDPGSLTEDEARSLKKYIFRKTY